MSKLFEIKTGRELKVGDHAKTFRGEDCVIKGWRVPVHSGSTGRVIINLGDEFDDEYFPSVIGAVIREN